MKINKNKGMYLETIINNSITFFENNNIAILRKQSIPIHINNIVNQNVDGFLIGKCDVDYYGIYKGRFIAMEAKQTSSEYFDLNKIPDHQLKFLSDIFNHKGISLLIIYFVTNDVFFAIPYNEIKNISIKNKIYFNNSELLKYKCELYFPGRLDFLKIVDKYLL